MKRINEYSIGDDPESLELIDNIIDLLRNQSKQGNIPQKYADRLTKRFEAIETALLEEHTKEFSDKVYAELRGWLINFEKAINKSKV